MLADEALSRIQDLDAKTRSGRGSERARRHARIDTPASLVRGNIKGICEEENGLVMTNEERQSEMGRRPLRLGVLLFFIGLLTGLALPVVANPRMALSSHLEGVMNGLFLLALGAIWHRLRLGLRPQRIAFWLVVYGTFVNWGTTLLAAIWGAGQEMMPLPAAGYTGTSTQETLIAVGLVSLSVAMLVVCPIVLWGLRSPAK